ncbi:hypothetical protein [Dactylosporangium sp. NPDC048998]|uniref:hypothetical protein n=1 Tax=Dactylosporangium sp. NPDC048998 TaxID=3363976 RepID=UPI003711BDDF
MRRMLVIAVVALACAASTLAGCKGLTAAPASAGDWPAGVKEAEVYAAVLRRYLTTPAESSFSEHTFTTVYVLDNAVAGAGDPMGTPGPGTPIAENTQRQVTAALAGTADVVFIADRNTVVENRDDCAQVKNGGILITFGPPKGDDNEVTVAVNGFVACLGATWLTYVVRNEPGSGWRVAGTIGPAAIA